MNDSKDIEETIAPRFLSNCLSQLVKLTQLANAVINFITLLFNEYSFQKEMNLDSTKEFPHAVKISSKLKGLGLRLPL